MDIDVLIFGAQSVSTIASTRAVEQIRVKKQDSIWLKVFPVISESSVVVIKDTLRDDRFREASFPRFLCMSPLYYEDIVIGGITVSGPAPQPSFPIAKVELLTSFCRIVTEIINTEAQQHRRLEEKYSVALKRWPQNLGDTNRNLIASFQQVDGTISKLLSLIPDPHDAKHLAEGTMDNLSLSLGELNFRLDVISSIGSMLQELRDYAGNTIKDEYMPGAKKITFDKLIDSINTAVATFGCEENFHLSIDQTAEMLNVISTFSDSIVTIFRCLFSFFDQSRVILNALCVVLVDHADFRCAIEADASTILGQICFEFVANGSYVWSPSFATLWRENDGSHVDADCPSSFAEQFEWLRDVLIRMGGGMTAPMNDDEDKEKFRSCMSVSIWFPCVFDKKDLLVSKEILLNCNQNLPLMTSPLSPLLDASNFSFAPSDLALKRDEVECPTHHAVLVIDDSILVQKIFKRIFSTLNIECEVVSNGISGLELMKTRHFDIVFVDFIMPEQGGVSTIQMFSEWRMNKLYSGMFVAEANSLSSSDISSLDDPLLIVGMSGTYDAPLVQEGFRNGVRVFLMKPISKEKCKAIYDAKISGQLNSEFAGKRMSAVPDGETI